MIRQPMRGKTEEQIKKERAAVVKELTDRGSEVVDFVFPDYHLFAVVGRCQTL